MNSYFSLVWLRPTGQVAGSEHLSFIRNPMNKYKSSDITSTSGGDAIQNATKRKEHVKKGKAEIIVTVLSEFVPAGLSVPQDVTNPAEDYDNNNDKDDGQNAAQVRKDSFADFFLQKGCLFIEGISLCLY